MLSYTNGNVTISVKDNTDTGIQGAIVELTNKSTGAVITSSATGSAGGATLTNVPGGEYTVKATADTYTTYNGSLIVNGDSTLNITMLKP